MKMIPQELVNQLLNTNNQSCINLTHNHANEPKSDVIAIIHIFNHAHTTKSNTFAYMIRVDKRRILQVQLVQLDNKHYQEFNQTNRTEF